MAADALPRAELVDPEDMAFEIEPAVAEADCRGPAAVPVPAAGACHGAARADGDRRAPPRSDAASPPRVAQAAPMPDPTLSSDMAEQLAGPGHRCRRSSSTFAQLNGAVHGGIGGVTLEA